MTLSECLNTAQTNITTIENNDGTVSVFVNSNQNIIPIQLKKVCCEAINPLYVFNADTQKCLWSTSSTCNLGKPFKIILNPKGNDGTLFYVDDNDNCTLDIQFDYLFKIKCETLGSVLTSGVGSCLTPVNVLETFDTSITIDIVTSANTLETVFETPLLSAIGPGNLYTYLTEHNDNNSGFYVCGDPTGSETLSACTPLSLTLTANPQTNVYTCVNVIDSIVSSLYEEAINLNPSLTQQEFYASFNQNVFASKWLTYKTTISDPTILNLITDEKIKLTIKVNKTCSDFCVLVDEISLNKVCTHRENKNIFLTKSPGFDLERIRDNKKSWVGNSTPTNRPFVISNNSGGNSIRQTNYDVNDERLVINTKEIDLDISLASAIETDVWCYLVDNSCLLSAITTTACTMCVVESCDGVKNLQNGDNFFFMDGSVYEFMYSDCDLTSVTSCQVGYTLTSASDACIKIETTGVTSGASLYTATHYDEPGWGISGTYFYEKIDNFIYPLNYSGTSSIGNNTIQDNNGSGVLVNVDSIVSNSGNTLWMNVYNGTNVNGRLNQIGVWDNTIPFNTWAGFSYCLDIPQSGVYSLGIAGDNQVRIKVNGELIINLTAGYDFNRFRRWHVFPITLTSGLNIIELEGLNTSGGAGFGAEIYDVLPQVLSAMTTTTQLSAVTLFSTSTEFGNALPLGSFSCPVDFSLNTCDVTAYTCTKITKITPTIVPGASFNTSVITTMCCGDYIDFNSLLSQPLSGITTIEDFEYIITSELIDVKSRKTLSGYPTLRALYDRYMGSGSFCQTNSSRFDYITMNEFSNLVGNYWVDIVEQVIPATTIWGSVKVYSNTLFDQQKYKYRSYTSLFGGNSFSGETVPNPINGTHGNCAPINVSITSVNRQTSGLTISNPTVTISNVICLAQMNSGSEFIGTVTIIGPNQNNTTSIYAI